MANSSGSATAPKAQQTKQDQGAVNTTAKNEADVAAQENNPAETWQEEQRLAKESQLQVAQRRPDAYVPDIGQAAGQASMDQLSDWEKQGSAEHKDVTAESVRDDLFERASLTPIEKAEGSDVNVRKAP